MSEKWGWDSTFGVPGTIECCKAEVRHYGGGEIDDVIAREMLDGKSQTRFKNENHPFLKTRDL